MTNWAKPTKSSGSHSGADNITPQKVNPKGMKNASYAMKNSNGPQATSASSGLRMKSCKIFCRVPSGSLKNSWICRMSLSKKLSLSFSAIPDSAACAWAAMPDISAAMRDISPPGAMIIGDGCVGVVAARAALETP
ncbi:Uncharacterised protein [Mycobacteroides abscessus subsp. massiliense]|uniref:Uncharacterized protein n=1 Tax=Mycobacteroides abscessus TaxID=36809 RepID=A0A0U0ZUQ9_9MYCO|nr:Uncharacterised protein [Mycobacteroides abscessus]SKG32828.1 Uncharacterised protein [Mycobacteroides abscessus subsp. massiliense]SKW27067.1 Uncharacterised protein [Mycobacteroides abscessus subsp. abscessus]SKH63390.1 Uncharacterised protein [Mycobacteroides abscessus subsp. massiliense]SKK03162.1 Uncharacterised protein [Mycobacteroides abscessus subsp. massiliense]